MTGPTRRVLSALDVPSQVARRAPASAGRAQDEADIAWLLRPPELDYALARDAAKRHLGFLLAGRKDLPPDYETETSNA